MNLKGFLNHQNRAPVSGSRGQGSNPWRVQGSKSRNEVQGSTCLGHRSPILEDIDFEIPVHGFMVRVPSNIWSVGGWKILTPGGKWSPLKKWDGTFL